MRWERVGLMVGASLAVVMTTACGSPKVHATTASTTTTTIPTQVPNNPSVRQEVSVTSCADSPGGWEAGGTVTNRLNHTATFKITVFFTNSGATDLAFGSISETVGSGKAMTWLTKATFSAPTTVLCVLRGVDTT